MRIRGWHVEGFGIHRDWRVDDLAGGLEVFYGPNEAGKSTLLAFLRGVLFGFPDGRSSENKYLPRDGAAHGGRVTLAGEAGEVVVERYAGRGKKVAVTLEDGRLGGEAELAQRRGRIDAALYRSVFAFGLRELQELGALGQADVQDHLFAAGVTGGGRPAREAARELSERARALFDGPKGRKKDRARSIIAEIAELNADLYARQELAETYPALRDRIDALDATLARLEADAAAARRVEGRAAKLVELWNEVWCPLAEAREQAAKLAPSLPESLPADARARLEEGRAEIARAEEHAQLVRREREALARQLDELRVDDRAFAVAARVDGLQARRVLDDSLGERLATLDAEREACASRITAASLRLFGEGGAEDALRAVHSTPQRREELRGWKARLDAEAAAVGGPEAASRVLEAQLSAAREKVRETLERASDAPESTREEVEQRLAALRAARALAPTLREAEADLAGRTDALASEAAGAGLLPGGALGTAAVACAVVAAAAGFVWVERLELALAVLALSLGVGSLALVRSRAAARARADAERVAREAAVEASRRVEALREEADSQLRLLGLAPGTPLDEGALAGVEEALRGALSRVEAADRSREELRGAREQVAGLEEQQRAEGRALAAARESLARVEEEFAAWKREAGVPAELGVDAALEFLDEVRHGRAALDERDRLDAELRRLAAERASFRAEVDAVLEAAEPPGVFAAPADDGERFAAFDRLRARCAADRGAREGREPLERRGVELRERFARCEAAVEAAGARVQALLVEAGAADLAALERSLELDAQAAALKERIAGGEAELSRRLAALPAEEASFLRGELESGSVSAWEEQAATARSQAESVAQERDVVLREHQDRTRDRKRLEESTEVALLELQKGELEQELREVLEEWRRLRVAAGLLEESVRRFEEAHQPGVLREASALFAQVTGGRYPKIVQADSGAGFAVLTADGVHRSPGKLSQGTAEQLYLCIRLGLVAEMSKAGRSLPVVMDDVLVNFDDERAAAMAGVLGSFAEHHQVLFFTCSSRTRDLLAAAPNATLHEIGAA